MIMLHIVTDVVSVSAIPRYGLERLVSLAIPHVLIQLVSALIPCRGKAIHAWLLNWLVVVLILVSLPVSAVAIAATRSGRSSWVFALLSASLFDGVQVVAMNDFVGC